MATITITIPDAKAQRVLDAFASAYGWTADIDDGEGGTIPNPESKSAHAKRQVMEFIKQVTLAEEAKAAAEAARQASIDSYDITLS